MSTTARNRLIGFALALAVFALDQWVKTWVTEGLGLNQIGENLPIVSIFDFTFTKNFGISLGMFQATSPEMRWGLVGLTALISLIVTGWMAREKLLGDLLALGLILGGAIGNIRDRFSLGYVIDYADLHFGDFRPFMIFNVADAAISIGVVIILVRSFLLGKKDGDDTSKPAPDAVESTNA